MRLTNKVMLALSLLSYAAMAQTGREKAVAIDHIEIPPTDTLLVEAIGPELHLPWSLAQLPDGSFLVTEKHRGLRRVGKDGAASEPIAGLPENVLTKEDSGYLDVALDPDFVRNANIYIAYVEGTEDSNRTAIWKAKLVGDKLVGGHRIFRSNFAKKAPSHPGGRLLFLPDGSLLLTVGDGYDYREMAQDNASHLGKILRLNRDGGVPQDNPFIGQTGYAPEIWTIGHRNVQGLTRDPATGLVWAHEHGPKGGDEINLLQPGKNYGWPKALFGIDYDGKRVSDQLHVDGMEDPLFFWAPSIAPSGLQVYHGNAFPEWEGKFLVGALAARSLILLRRGKQTGLLVEEARLLSGLRSRIRDIQVASDGSVLLLTDSEQGRILRLNPKPREQSKLAPEHHLAPVAALLGDWTGISQFRPLADAGRRVVGETSRTKCSLLFANYHMRCTTEFTRADGKARIVEQTFSRGTSAPDIHAIVIGDRWAGYSIDPYKFDPVTEAFIAEKPFETGGRKFIESIKLMPAPDGNSVVVVEAARPAEGGDWTETFRWEWKKSK